MHIIQNKQLLKIRKLYKYSDSHNKLKILINKSVGINNYRMNSINYTVRLLTTEWCSHCPNLFQVAYIFNVLLFFIYKLVS